MGSRATHEKVRLARDLEALPLVTAAFAAGELSYSKVRALTKIADNYLAHPDRLRCGNDRYTTLVIVDEDTLTGADPDGSWVLDDGTHIDTPTAHHIIHWADHGPTAMDNLVLLGHHHHRAIHEGGYTVAGLIATERGRHNPDNRIAGGDGHRPDIIRATDDSWPR